MDTNHYSRFLKTSYSVTEIDQVLQSPVTALNGVGQAAAALLNSLDIYTVFDLAHSRVFNNAYNLTFSDEQGASYRGRRMVPADVINLGIITTNSQIEWPTQSISVLKGTESTNAKAIEETLSASTIRDLALWPPFQAARQLVGIADGKGNSFIDEEIPQELVPKFNEHASEKSFYSIYIVDEGTVVNEGDQPSLQDLQSPISLETVIQLQSTEVPRTGAILRYEQSWTPIALTLGNLLHSLALAPGESTRIAIIDWTRRQGVRTTEAVSQLESLSSSLMQTRSISEVTSAVAREAQRGFSRAFSNSSVSNTAETSYGLQNSGEVMAAVGAGIAAGAGAGAVGGRIAGAGIGAVAGGLIGSGAAGIGAVPGLLVGGLAGSEIGSAAGGLIGATAGGVGALLTTAEFGSGQTSNSSSEVETVTTTSSSGNRDVAAQMLQNIQDRTHQHASTSRNKHASIVQETSQQETENISTRVVTNYNHMHALTIQYFEVVQVYSVRTTLVQKQPCLYIPFLPVQWNVELARLYRQQIIRNALTSDVAYTLLSLEKTVLLFSPTFSTIPNEKIQERLSNSTFLPRLEEARRLLNSFVSGNPLDSWRIPDHFMINQVWNTAETGGLGPLGAKSGQYPVKHELVFHYHDGSRRVAGNVDIEKMPNADVMLKNISGITYEITNTAPSEWDFTEALSEPLYYNMNFTIADDRSKGKNRSTGDDGAINFYAHYMVNLSQVVGNKLIIPVLTLSRAMAMANLIQHLNENSRYYTERVLRMKNNPLVRHVLSNYSFNGKPLINQVDQEPVAISGNNLIFLLHESKESTDETSDQHKVGSVSKNSIIPLGTGGVFAEAVQGRANAAEKLDITRFWNWQDSPIPIVAPEIAPVQSGSRSTPIDGRPGSLDAPLVQYITPNALPAPQSIPAILQTISTQMFRDMSGIAQTAQLAQRTLETAMEGATTTGAQASENLQQGLQFTKELLAKIVDMNSDFAQLLVKAGVQAMGVAGFSSVAAGNTQPGLASKNPSTAGAILNKAKNMDDQRTGEAIENNSALDSASSDQIHLTEDAIRSFISPGSLSFNPPSITPNNGTNGVPRKKRPRRTIPQPVSPERVIRLFVNQPGINVPINGIYDLAFEEPLSGHAENHQFEIKAGNSVGQARSRLPFGIWTVQGRLMAVESIDTVSVPVSVIPGLAPFDFVVSQEIGSAVVVFPFNDSLTVGENTRVVDLRIQPEVEDFTINREITLNAEITASGAFDAQAKAGVEAETNFIIENVKAQGELALGLNLSLSGRVAAGEKLTLTISYKRVKGFKAVQTVP